MEILRELPDLPGYGVTQDGRVYTHKSGRWLGQRDAGNGYPVVKAGGKNRYVHVLVARAWVGPKPGPAYEVRHKDGNPYHNAACNLVWGTAKENAEDRDRHGRTYRGSRHHSSKLSDQDVQEIRRRYAEGGISQAALAAEFGVRQSSICGIVNGKVRKHG